MTDDRPAFQPALADGDGKVEIHIGHHGEVFGDQMSLYLVLGGGNGTPIDALASRSPDGRWLAIVRGKKVELVDAQSGHVFELRGADAQSDGRPGAPHRATMFANNRLLYIRTGGGTDDRLVVHDPSDHSEREIAVPGRLWRIDYEPRSPRPPLRRAGRSGVNPGGGPHSLTGPIFVNGAEPGDVLEIRILKIVPKKVGVNFNLPGKEFPTIGALPKEFPDGFVKYFDLDWKTRTTVFKPGITVPLRPFPGILAVGIDPDDPSPRKGGVKDDKLAPVSSLRPWKNGSNMDINELTERTTVFIPVFQKGGLIWTGDSHCAQGNGEVNLTAIECSFEEIMLQPIVRKDLKLTWPRIETQTHHVLVGFDEDLDKAFVNAITETVDFLVTTKGLTSYEAYSLAAVAADCRVSQVVDIRKGVHCMVPKSLFTAAKARK